MVKHCVRVANGFPSAPVPHLPRLPLSPLRCAAPCRSGRCASCSARFRSIPEAFNSKLQFQTNFQQFRYCDSAAE